MVRLRQFTDNFVVFGGIYKLRLAVLADPNAGLRPLDPPAADAQPSLHSFGHHTSPRLHPFAAYAPFAGFRVITGNFIIIECS